MRLTSKGYEREGRREGTEREGREIPPKVKLSRINTGCMLPSILMESRGLVCNLGDVKTLKVPVRLGVLVPTTTRNGKENKKQDADEHE